MTESGMSKVQRQTAGAELASEVDQLWEQLRQKDAQILMLQKKLQHFRSWVSNIHNKVQQMNPQAIKNSRRLYIGGITPETTEDELRQLLNSLMMKTGALTSPGSAIISCKITQEKNYAFVEFRSVEETSNAMALDGVAFKDTYLKIRRPSNYDVSTAIMLGPIQPDPTMDVSTLDICRTVVEDSPHKLFVGGLPCDWTEEQVKELLVPYGSLKSFNLVMDKATGKSKGYAFCEYAEETITDFVIKSLNQKKLASKTLTVKRALEGSKQGPAQGGVQSNAPVQGSFGGLFPSGPAPPANPLFASPQNAPSVFPHGSGGGQAFPNNMSNRSSSGSNYSAPPLNGGQSSGGNGSGGGSAGGAAAPSLGSGMNNNPINGFGVGQMGSMGNLW